MKKSLMLLTSVILIVGLFTIVGYGAKAEAAKPNDMSGQIVIGTHEIGTGGYQTVALIIEGMAAKFPGLRIRALPAGIESSRALYGRLGDVQVIIQGGAAPLYLQEGTFDYSGSDWGPQPVRFVFASMHNGYSFGVQANSPIKTVADLKGKKVAATPAAISTNQSTEAMLAFGGLTWKDVQPVAFSSIAQAYSAVADGKIDACFFNVAAPAALEAMAGPSGLRFLSFPASDKEGWARAKNALGTVVSRLTIKGAGLSADKPLESMSEAYPVFLSWANADTNSIYKLTKAIIEARPEWSKKDASLEKDFTLENSWKLFDAGRVPMHEGAIRYYKEISQWTGAREKKNQEILAHQKALKELWDKTKKAAIDEKVKSTDFPKFWMEARKNARF